MTAEITVRPATMRDLPQLISLVELCAEAPQWPQAVWQQVLTSGERSDQRIVFLAETDQTSAGFGVLNFADNFGEIESLAVHPALRRQGIGRRLCETMLDYAKECGAARVLLDVRVTNRAARSLYQSLGFEEGGVRRRYYHNPDEDAVMMAMSLPR